MDSQQPQYEEQEKKSPGKIIIMILVAVWVILGIAGIIMSIVCFGRSGSTSQHVVGLLLAILFGPIYWIFYFVVPDYCKRIFS